MSSSTKPYLLRALYEWCTDSGFTPYIVVIVDSSTKVPMEFVKNGEIVLNISADATRMQHLVTRLLQLARIQSAPEAAEIIPLDTFCADLLGRYNGQVRLDASAAPPPVPEPEPTGSGSQGRPSLLRRIANAFRGA